MHGQDKKYAKKKNSVGSKLFEDLYLE